MDLNQDDLDFLSQAANSLNTDPVYAAALAELKQAAADGNATAIGLVPVVETSARTAHLVNAEMEEMMKQAVAAMDMHCPQLLGASVNRGFAIQLAPFLEAVIRDSFARGWLACEKAND